MSKATVGTPDHETSQATVEDIVSMMDVGEPRKIALAEVTQATLKNNLGLQSSLVAPEIAAAQLRGERAKFEATFDASVTQGRTVSPQFYGERTIGVKNDSLTISPSLDVPLRTGGSVNLDWTVATQNFVTGGQAPAQGSAVSQPGISLEQPLLRGAGFAYNEASIVIAESNLGAERSAAQLLGALAETDVNKATRLNKLLSMEDGAP